MYLVMSGLALEAATGPPYHPRSGGREKAKGKRQRAKARESSAAGRTIRVRR